MAPLVTQLLVLGLIVLLAVLTASGIWFMFFRAPLIPHLIRILYDEDDVDTSDDAKKWFQNKELEAYKSGDNTEIILTTFVSGVYHCSDCQAVWTGLLAVMISSIAAMFVFGTIGLYLILLWPAAIPLVKLLQKF